MSKAGVYKLTAPNGKCYIGQSINLDSRFRVYKGNHCSSQVHLHRAIKKYGWDSFKTEILWGTDKPERFKNISVLLDTLEIAWIKKFNSIENGYNLMLGGSFGGHSEETKEKMSKARIKYLADENNLEKLRESIKNRSKREYTPEILKTMSETTLNFMADPVKKAKWMESLKKRPKSSFSPEDIAKATKARQKAVTQYTLEGEFVAEYGSIKEAALAVGGSQTGIGNCLRKGPTKDGRPRTSFGYRWEYNNKERSKNDTINSN